MTNKYRSFDPSRLQAAGRTDKDPEVVEGLFDGGIVLDRSPQHLQVNQSPDLDKVRVHRGGLRADFGLITTTPAASSRVLALGEHRFINTALTLTEKIFRLLRDGSNFPVIESLNTSTLAWANELTGDFVVADILHSWRSYFAAVFFADGDQVYKWDQSTLVDDAGNDFPSGNEVTDSLDSVDVTVTPAGGQSDVYTVHFSVTISGPEGSDSSSISVIILHGGEIVAERLFLVSENEDSSRVISFPHEQLTFIREITDLDVVTLRTSGRAFTPVARSNSATDVWPGFPTSVTIPKTPSRAAVDHLYEFSFFLDDQADSGDSQFVEFYADFGAGNVLLDVAQFAFGAHTHTIPTAGIEAQGGEPDSFTLTIQGTPANWSFQEFGEVGRNKVEWEETWDISVKGFNLATDADPAQGITYSVSGAQANEIVQVEDEDGDLVVGRHLGVFANRVLVLQADNDPQKIKWPANGDPTLWLADGAGETILPSQSDPIDELMAFYPLSSEVGILFRKRSIMRVVPTGQLDPALAFFPWIEKLGTESPFSVAIIPGGLIFLGSDREVYVLTEGGPNPVGPPVMEDFQLSDSNIGLVEGLYDPIQQEYILYIPEN